MHIVNAHYHKTLPMLPGSGFLYSLVLAVAAFLNQMF